jgi:hypothetical protein
MTREDIIRMAREAGEYADQHHEKHDSWLEAERLQFAALVAAAERERLAQHFDQANMAGIHSAWVAAAIRKGRV